MLKKIEPHWVIIITIVCLVFTYDCQNKNWHVLESEVFKGSAGGSKSGSVTHFKWYLFPDLKTLIWTCTPFCSDAIYK